MKFKKSIYLLLTALLTVASATAMTNTYTAQAATTSIVKSATKTVGVSYSSYVQNIGWQSPVSNGQKSGTSGKALRIEALKINLINAPKGAHIKYQAHVENIGWQNPVIDNAISGTSGQAKRIEAIKIALENLPGYSVQYRVHVQNIGWQSWVSDGAIAGTTGRGLRVEAVEIRVVKTANGSTPTSVPFISTATPPTNTNNITSSPYHPDKTRILTEVSKYNRITISGTPVTILNDVAGYVTCEFSRMLSVKNYLTGKVLCGKYRVKKVNFIGTTQPSMDMALADRCINGNALHLSLNSLQVTGSLVYSGYFAYQVDKFGSVNLGRFIVEMEAI